MVYYPGKTLVAKYNVDLVVKTTETLFVYCNVLEHVVVRDVMTPLLRIVDMKRRTEHGRMHKILNPLLYVPLQKKNFDTIETNIMTDTGEHARLHTASQLRCWSLNVSGCSKKSYIKDDTLQFSSFAIVKRKASFCCDASHDMYEDYYTS